MMRFETTVKCRACGSPVGPDAGFDLGEAGVSNRFEKPGAELARDDGSYALSLCDCARCSLVQLGCVPDVNALRPRVSWIRYNEPEKHLDALAAALDSHLGIGGKTVLGVGPFEAPLAERLVARGAHAQQLDILAGSRFGAQVFPYLESMQDVLSRGALPDPKGEAARAAVVSCRYLLEHCDDPVSALHGLARRLLPDGRLLIEVPDSAGFLSRKDYSFLWEEHTCYFTEASFRRFAHAAGFEVELFLRFPGQLEDALVFLLKPGAAAMPELPAPDRSLFANYRDAFPDVRAQYRQSLDRLRQQGRKLAIFGAGHQTVMFASLFGLAEYLELAVDDHPGKLGCRLPGTRAEIVSTDAFLAREDVDVCLLGVNPQIMHKIVEKCERFTARGGVFHSIYPSAPLTTLIDEMHQ